MTRSELLAWLEARRPAPPAALRGRLAAVAEAATESGAPLAEHLAALGESLVSRVAGQPQGGRELALDLLAADAFVTYAFEAQTERDVTRLAALADRVTAGRRRYTT